MAKQTLLALLASSVIGLSGTALAQGVPPGGLGGAIGGRSIIGTTPADDMPAARHVGPPPAYIEEDTVVVTPNAPDQTVVAQDQTTVVQREVVPLYRVRPARSLPWSAGMAGGVGGAIGGRAILGPSSADDIPLPLDLRH